MKQVCSIPTIAVLVWGAWVVEGAQRSNRLLVLFVDDLHLEFRSTPRIRELLLRRVLPRLIRDGDSVGLVTTGYSSVAMRPTTDREAIVAGLRKITGNGLRADEIVAAASSDERLRRATIAIATAQGAIHAMAADTLGPNAVIYVSGGYGDESVLTDLAELILAANRANVTIHTFDALGVVGPTSEPSPANEAAWQTYFRAARDSLRRLADSTGGQVVSTLGRSTLRSRGSRHSCGMERSTGSLLTR